MKRSDYLFQLFFILLGQGVCFNVGNAIGIAFGLALGAYMCFILGRRLWDMQVSPTTVKVLSALSFCGLPLLVAAVYPTVKKKKAAVQAEPQVLTQE